MQLKSAMPEHVHGPAIPREVGLATRRAAAMASATSARSVAALATLALGAASWLLAVRQMNAMDMGVATRLGSFASFVGLWVSMMAAMMLPGAVPAVWNLAQAGGRVHTVPFFLGSYLAVWTFVGIAIYALYQPHGSLSAGVVAITAGIYECTPLKQRCRQRCRERARSGFQYGFCCVGSGVGLMAMLVALGVMSIAWMSVIAVPLLAQKLPPAKATIDVPLALVMVGFGILIVLAPSSVPGLTPSM